ncbi:MAG: DUF3656 domain-containing protein [Bacillota bacterium]
MMNKKPELLSPVGTKESLLAAVANGCDAVYLGGQSFNARESAKNFTIEEIAWACDFCHLRGVKVYVTVNTLCKENELQKVLDFVGELYKIGVDALILQDLGVATLIKEHFPDFPLHASTQLTANSLNDVEHLSSLGFQKVVLSRELSLMEIAEIKQNTNEIEIETFIHGAICVSYSGQCIMSSMLGGRSGNRGRCAQTCRLPYTLYRGVNPVIEGHLLSPKDMQTLAILPDLIESGIDSLKIEGRMKNPEYVAGVTKIYRKYIDLYFENKDNYKVELTDTKILLELFNRGGFSEGYYHQTSGADMIGIERPKPWGLHIGFVDSYIPKYHRVTIRTRESLVPGDGIEIWTDTLPHVGTNISKASKQGEVITVSLEGNIEKNNPVYRTYGKTVNDSMKKTWEKDVKKQAISGFFQANIGKPMALQLWDANGSNVYLTGETVEKSDQKGTPEEKIEQQLKKMGSTPFSLETLTLQCDVDIFLSVSALNQLRREAVSALESAIIKKTKREASAKKRLPQEDTPPFIVEKEVHVLVSSFPQLEIIVSEKSLHTIYFEVDSFTEKDVTEAIALCQKHDIRLYVALPKVSREWRKNELAKQIDYLKTTDIDGFLVRTQGQFFAVQSLGKKITLDYTFNVMNRESVQFWKSQGADSVCLSVESNLQEINAMGDCDCQMVVHGYLPLMKTQQCPVGNYVGEKNGSLFCKEKNNGDVYFLKDRKGMKFPLVTDCKNCVCTILNSQPLFTLKFYNEILCSVTGSVRLDFTKEGPGKVARFVKAYCEMTKERPTISDATRTVLDEMQEKGNTKGHFFRGVE